MRIKNSLKNIYTGLIGQSIILITGFIVRTFFIRKLGNTYLGVSGLFTNILTILSFAELGIGQAIIYSLYKPIANDDTKKIQALMNLYKKTYKALFFIVLILGLCLLPFLNIFIKDINSIPYIRIIYIMYILDSSFSYLFAYKTSFLVATQKNYIVNKTNSIVSILVAAFQIITLIFFENYFVYLGIQISSKLLQNMYIANKANKIYPFLKEKNDLKVEDRELAKIKKNVSALILYKIGTLSLNSTDNIIMSAYVGLSTVGIYSNYNLIVTSVTGFLSTIFNNLTASIGNLNASEDNDKKYFMFKVINLATFWLYGVVTVCIFVLINPFIGVCWIGKDYLLDPSVVFIISLNVYIAGMLYAPFNYRQTMGLFVQGKFRPIISAIENIILSIILVKYMGISGVFWGTAITRLTTNAWFDPYLIYTKGLNINPIRYFIDYIVKLLVLGFTLAICTIVSNIIVINNFFQWLLMGIIIFIISNIIFFFYACKTKEFSYLRNIFKSMVLKRVKN